MTVETFGKRAHRFQYLDVLRLLCAGAVVVFHNLVVSPFTRLTPGSLLTAPHLLVYGQFGVQVFFMISGFVITLSARGRTASGFLWARFLRLFPGYWICCVITALTILAIGNGDHSIWKPSLPGFVINLSMLGGFLNTPYVDQVYWSLKPELQFYAYIAALLVIGVRVDSLSLIATWLGVCLLGMFTHGLVGKVISNLGMTEVAPFFVVGMLVQSTLDGKRVPLKVGMVAVALLLASRLVFEHAVEFGNRGLPAPDPFISVGLLWVGALLVVGSAHLRAPARLQSAMMALGAMTYPLYLVHNVAGALLTAQLARIWPAGVALAVSLATVIAAVLLIALLLEPGLRLILRRWGADIHARFAELRTAAAREHGAPPIADCASGDPGVGEPCPPTTLVP